MSLSFLFFSWHSQKKYKFIRIDGSTSAENRSKYVDKFQNDDDVKVAILSIVAANAGINLTAASLVVFTELFWNPGVRKGMGIVI